MKRFSKEWWFWTIVPLGICSLITGAIWFSMVVIALMIGE